MGDLERKKEPWGRRTGGGVHTDQKKIIVAFVQQFCSAVTIVGYVRVKEGVMQT